MMTIHVKNRMTLIEVLVAMTVLLVIMSVLAAMVHDMNRIARIQRKQSEIYQDQRLLMDIISRDISGMTCNSDSDRPSTCEFVPTPGTTGTKAWFITGSGLGLQPTDYCSLTEVAYQLTSDSELIRWYTRSGKDPTANSKWNFLTDTEPASWGGTNASVSDFDDSAVLATSVKDFYVQSYSGIDGAAFTGDTDVMPSLVVATIELYDDVDKTVRTFQKKIFLKQGR